MNNTVLTEIRMNSKQTIKQNNVCKIIGSNYALEFTDISAVVKEKEKNQLRVGSEIEIDHS